jgi:hypothetical protein
VSLLYVDVLGMKARYRMGGVAAARETYSVFAERVSEGLAALPTGRRVSGGIQSDAVALQFDSTIDALHVGRALFRATFERSTNDTRTWVRGVIMKGGAPGTELQHEGPLPNAPSGVFERHFTDELLGAIAAEQVGFRGQRLLIDRRLVTPLLHDIHGVQGTHGRVASAKKLQFSACPVGFQDVLWPVPGDLGEWSYYLRKMVDRLRYATRGGDQEFLHASATHLLFAEIASIVYSIEHGD